MLLLPWYTVFLSANGRDSLIYKNSFRIDPKPNCRLKCMSCEIIRLLLLYDYGRINLRDWSSTNFGFIPFSIRCHFVGQVNLCGRQITFGHRFNQQMDSGMMSMNDATKVRH